MEKERVIHSDHYNVLMDRAVHFLISVTAARVILILAGVVLQIIVHKDISTLHKNSRLIMISTLMTATKIMLSVGGKL